MVTGALKPFQNPLKRPLTASLLHLLPRMDAATVCAWSGQHQNISQNHIDVKAIQHCSVHHQQHVPLASRMGVCCDETTAMRT